MSIAELNKELEKASSPGEGGDGDPIALLTSVDMLQKNPKLQAEALKTLKARMKNECLKKPEVAVLCMSVLDQFMESLGPSFHEAARKKTLDRLVKLSVPNSKECAPPVQNKASTMLQRWGDLYGASLPAFASVAKQLRAEESASVARAQGKASRSPGSSPGNTAQQGQQQQQRNAATVDAFLKVCDNHVEVFRQFLQQHAGGDPHSIEALPQASTELRQCQSHLEHMTSLVASASEVDENRLMHCLRTSDDLSTVLTEYDSISDNQHLSGPTGQPSPSHPSPTSQTGQPDTPSHPSPSHEKALTATIKSPGAQGSLFFGPLLFTREKKKGNLVKSFPFFWPPPLYARKKVSSPADSASATFAIYYFYFSLFFSESPSTLLDRSTLVQGGENSDSD